MIAIQTFMLVALGFLLAGLLIVCLTPAYRARIVRLTSNQIRASLPITEQELNADKDRIRAENAIRVHKLGTQLEQLKVSAARQQIEVNRRDGIISNLTRDVEALRSELDGAHNARNVLEDTIADRLPRVEQRLIEAKRLLFQRDRDIATLTSEAGKTHHALVEAVQINAQHRAEIGRLSMIIKTRNALNRDGLSDPTFDAEVALRSEIDALRERSREQTALIEHMQSANGDAANAPIPLRPLVVGAGHTEAAPVTAEIDRLKRELELAEAALKGFKTTASVGEAGQLQLEAQLTLRHQTIEDQANEIARLTAALATFKADPDNDKATLKESKIAMKSRLGALKAQTDAQTDTISRLRSELAALNERLARQAQHHMDEMRRLGAGTLPASAPIRRPQAAGAARRSLIERITETKPDLAYGAGMNSAAGARPERVAVLVPRPDTSTGPANDPENGIAGSSQGQSNGRPEAPRPRLLQRITEHGKG